MVSFVCSQSCVALLMYLISADFHHSKQDTIPISSRPHSRIPQPLETIMYTHLEDLPLLYAVGDLVCLLAFTQHSVFRDHPCCSMYQTSFLFVAILHFDYPYIGLWIFGCVFFLLFIHKYYFVEFSGICF